MKSWYQGICFLLIFLLGYSCKTQQSNSPENQIVIYPTESSHFVSDLQPYIDTIQAIPLEMTDCSLISYISKILTLPNGNLIIASNRLLVFTSDGKYLFAFDQQGRGPEEYYSAIDICLSQDNKVLCILTPLGEIVQYDVENGKFIQKISLQRPENSEFIAIASGANGSFFLFATRMLKANTPLSESHFLFHFDFNGKLIKSYLPQKDYIFDIALITQSYNNQYILRPQDPDNICYYLADTIPAARIKIDFGPKTIPAKYSSDTHTYMLANYYKLPIYIHETQQHYFFTYCGPQALEHYCLYSFPNHKTITWKRTGKDSNALLQLQGSDSEFFYAIYNDYRKSDEISLSEIDLLKKAVIQKTGIELTEESNPYLIKIKFKL